MEQQTENQEILTFRGRNGPMYRAAQRHLDTPMTVFALLLGVILAVQYFVDLSDSTNSTLNVLTWFIWAAFVIEYMTLLWLAPNKREMVRTHILDLFLILVPFLRPLRVLRLLRAAAGLGSAVVMARRIMKRRGMQWALLSVTAIIVVGAGLTLLAERDHPDAAIDSFGTALWWAIVTCTTVGYGDVSPITAAGRATAVVLMIVGIALLSLVTANIASLFVEQDTQDENEALREQLEEVNRKLDQLLSQ